MGVSRLLDPLSAWSYIEFVTIEIRDLAGHLPVVTEELRAEDLA